MNDKDISLKDTFVVEKSRPLALMKEVPFSIGELKVLDTYLARINPRDPKSRVVRFTKDEYEDLMGIDRMRPERLEKYIKNLMGQTCKIPDESSRNGYKLYTLFDEATIEPDGNGQWHIELSCTTKAKRLFFNIEGIGYIRYQLSNIINLQSRYSVFLYIYLRDNFRRKTWTVNLEDFTVNILKCTAEVYLDSFKYMKRDILEKSVEEINTHTDIKCSYTAIKGGRRVRSLEWTVCENKRPGTATTLAVEIMPYSSKWYVEDMKLSEEAIYEISSMMSEFNDNEIKELVYLALEKATNTEVASYLRKKLLLLSNQLDINHKMGWMRKAIQQNWGESEEVKRESSYDLDEIEKFNVYTDWKV